MILYLLGVFLAFSLGFLLAALLTGGSQGTGAQEAYATGRLGTERPGEGVVARHTAWTPGEGTKVS